jgi:hydrogenase nickel incorporation protein HypA/HybF
MHELSIADAVLQTVERHAAGRRVTAVELEVGHLRQVVPSALSFAWELITAGTLAEGSELEIREVPAAGFCRSCEAETELPDLPLRCGRCGGFDLELLRGEELLIDSLEVEEEQLVSSNA